MVTHLSSDGALEALETLDGAVMIADVIDEGSWVTWVNPAFTRIFGYTLEEMVGGGLIRMMGPHTDLVEVDRMYQEVLSGNRGTATTVAYCSDGSEFWSTFTMSPVFAEGRVVRWVGIHNNVTDHVRRSAEDRKSYELERRARIGLSVLARASDLLADVDDPHVLRLIAEMLARRLVSWAGFFVDDGTLRPIDGIDPEAEDRARALARAHAQDRAEAGGGFPADPVRAMSASAGPTRGEVQLDAAYPAGSPAASLVARVHAHREANRDAASSALVLPVLGRGRTLCLLVAVPLDRDMRDAEATNDIAGILELVARRVGITMENVLLYAREHQLAETLQRAMLPEQADVDGLDVWTYYAPNAEHAQVGGDWYDVLHVDAETVGLVIGDVVGHDVEAAATMGQLRSVVRSYACELVDPGTVLMRVDALVAGMRISRAASLVYATMTPVDGGWDVAYSRAGHLPPLRIRDGVVTSLDEAGGALIGFGTRPRETGRARAEPGDVLLFYTDGLLERRDRPLRVGVDALTALCARITAPDAAGVGEEVLQFADAPEDDVAVVVVRVPVPAGARSDVGPSARQRQWAFPADAHSISRARHAVVSACEAWGIKDSSAAELVVSELVANAVLHGWGRVDLRIQDPGDGLRIEVEDANPVPPTAVEGAAANVGGFGLHIVSRLADWGWRPAGTGKVVWARIRSDRARRDAGPG